MTAAQRSTYFGKLWPAACATQKWHVKDAERRREVTFQATQQESTSSLSQDGITLLFDHLLWLANPHDFDCAYKAANPELSIEQNKRDRVIWRVRQAANKGAFNDVYLAKSAEHKCRVHNVRTWDQLPLVELVNFSKTITARARKKALVQEVCTGSADDPF